MNVPKLPPLPPMNDGLFALLRFLRHEFERALEHADLHIEGIDELDAEGREIATEVSEALLEGIEFNQGYILDAFAALGALKAETCVLPTPGGERTVAVLHLSPHESALACLGLKAGEQVLFDGVFAYLRDHRGTHRLWMEIADEPIPVAQAGKLPIVR